jgi:hypothetical protein
VAAHESPPNVDASGQRVVLTVGQVERAPSAPAGVRLRTVAYSVPVVGGVPQVPAPPVTLPDVRLSAANVLPPDSAVRTVESGVQSSSCVTKLRWATALASAWGETPLTGCAADPGRRFNAPPSIAGLGHP